MLFKLFGFVVCVLRSPEEYVLKEKMAEERQRRKIAGLLAEKQIRAAARRGDVLDNIRLYHENEALCGQLEEYKQKYADELQKRLDLSERVRELEVSKE